MHIKDEYISIVYKERIPKVWLYSSSITNIDKVCNLCSLHLSNICYLHSMFHKMNFCGGKVIKKYVK